MVNIYHEHLEHLRKMKSSESPAVSLFIPLRWADFPSGKIFSALTKAADKLLLNDGHQKLNLQTPEWERWLAQGTVTLAIYHHKGVSHLIPLPTKMQPRVVVADSFHIKPIVAASHEYVDALLLHFHENGASLFRIHPAGENLLDRYLPSEIVPKQDWPHHLERQSLREFLEFLLQEIRGSLKLSTKFVAITGTGYPELRSELFWRRLKLPVTFLDESFKFSTPQNSVSITRQKLFQIINDIHSDFVMSALLDRGLEQDENLMQLAPKIIRREIRKLCVSLDCMQFGQLESKTGEITINRIQQSSNDDDLLDDLIELAIDRGIEVRVVPKKFLPKGRSFIAS